MGKDVQMGGAAFAKFEVVRAGDLGELKKITCDCNIEKGIKVER